MYSFRKTIPQEVPQTEFVVIQYPGLIKNLDRALETLGGLPKISQVNHFSGHALELRHTPDNPYTSATVSEKKTDATVTSGTLRLVMEFRRKKKKPQTMEVNCLGLVNYVYTFETMCDFQYLPLKKRAESDAFDDLIPRLIPRDLPSALCWYCSLEPNFSSY
ncbi:unnamed protein product [Nippostrongylus brasiliensis]|uniref:Tau95_N domain-containing protein n=1 Tax=Nippostrongylus brasiliensis TaxID=27835 RepID=A0A0N4YKY3_NIPBR|nr:unnamed protein product [Nippostrongylus brasiliensis]